MFADGTEKSTCLKHYESVLRALQLPNNQSSLGFVLESEKQFDFTHDLMYQHLHTSEMENKL